ncbi:hypothetical protein [Paenibacillus sp. FSL P2-0173]|uniref:hypothetical protein n=1 Tax=Paenibacillus sp. FSL P2-0173 TaxID=2921627 RepID=UPI0030FAAF3F
MGKKLKGHGLFECPRFMLPEHATCIREQYRRSSEIQASAMLDELDVKLKALR